MERTVPTTASDEIDLYLRTVYSLLRSTTEVQIRTLEEVHAGMNSLLHSQARQETPDMSAFIYSMLRLPSIMPDVKSVVLGQNQEVFTQHGFGGVENWQVVTPRARRRRCFFNGEGTLACYIASRSDIDDIVPTLVAYQIEWNKLHILLQRRLPGFDFISEMRMSEFEARLAEALYLSVDDIERLILIWGGEFATKLQQIADQPCSLGLRLLSGSLSEYRRATHAWWRNIVRSVPQVTQKPVYFVSSNTHSIANLLTGFALTQPETLIQRLTPAVDQSLLEEWRQIQLHPERLGRENFLYYVLKKVQQGPGCEDLLEAQREIEAKYGITRIPSEHYFDVDAQVIDLSCIDSNIFDLRLRVPGMERLSESNALIINIDYPLGVAAYNILSKMAEQTAPILGVYMMGKAATLNAAVGDVMIPNVVHDEHSRNTYLFQNAFDAADVATFLIYGTVLDNQKAVSVGGTFLQNAQFMDVFYREGYTDIEMEAGPYLSAIYEMYRPQRYPANEIVNLYGVPFDIGVLHYASDTPLGKGRNLGAGTLSFAGMDATYATSIAILRRILTVECQRLSA